MLPNLRSATGLRPNSFAKARSWPAAVLATDTHGCALVCPLSGLVIVSPSARRRHGLHVGRPGLDVDREHRAVLRLEDVERLQTRRNALPFGPCLIRKPVRWFVGASRVKFGGCGTTGHRLAIEAGDADEIDAEPEGRGLAGCWGRVRVLHCCRRWRLHGLAAVGRSQLLDASRGPVGEEAAQEGVGEGQVTPDGAARPRR